MEGADEGVEMVANSKDLQQESKAFAKLTDRVEDRQLDSTRVQEAMASISASAEADWNAMHMRETSGGLVWLAQLIYHRRPNCAYFGSKQCCHDAHCEGAVILVLLLVLGRVVSRFCIAGCCWKFGCGLFFTHYALSLLLK